MSNSEDLLRLMSPWFLWSTLRHFVRTFPKILISNKSPKMGSFSPACKKADFLVFEYLWTVLQLRFLHLITGDVYSSTENLWLHLMQLILILKFPTNSNCFTCICLTVIRCWRSGGRGGWSEISIGSGSTKMDRHPANVSSLSLGSSSFDENADIWKEKLKLIHMKFKNRCISNSEQKKWLTIYLRYLLDLTKGRRLCKIHKLCKIDLFMSILSSLRYNFVILLLFHLLLHKKLLETFYFAFFSGYFSAFLEKSYW